MGIKSEPFRGVVLSGEDIEKFDKQVRKSRPSKAAVATITRGKRMVGQLQKKGYVTYRTKRVIKVG